MNSYSFMPDKKMTPQEIANNLEIVRYAKAWLKRLKLTQSKIADLMNVSEPTVSKWLRGTQTMSAAQVMKLVDIMGIPLEAMLAPPGDDRAALRVKRMLVLSKSITDEELAAIEALLAHKSEKT